MFKSLQHAHTLVRRWYRVSEKKMKGECTWKHYTSVSHFLGVLEDPKKKHPFKKWSKTKRKLVGKIDDEIDD